MESDGDAECLQIISFRVGCFPYGPREGESILYPISWHVFVHLVNVTSKWISREGRESKGEKKKGARGIRSFPPGRRRRSVHTYMFRNLFRNRII